jgi:hypothetical protein
MTTNLAEPKQSRVTRKWYVVTRKYHSRICALVTLLSLHDCYYWVSEQVRRERVSRCRLDI